MWKNSFSSFEKKEISKIEKVYYHQKMNSKNDNFDTESGRLKMDVKQHLIYRFEIMKLIDKGSVQPLIVFELEHRFHGDENVVSLFITASLFTKP